MHASITRTAVPLVASALLVLIALALLEWVTSNSLGESMTTSGVLSGIAMAGLLFLVPCIGAQGAWAAACNAVLRTITELAFAAILIYALAAASILFLPSWSQSLAQTDRITDLIVFVFLALGMLVAARAWRRLSHQKATAAAAVLDALQAKAALAIKEKALLESEMLLLRAQIEPHFLWNTLGQLQYLVTKSPQQAARMTAHLIGFLRATVPSAGGRESTLGTEVGAVHDYLEIMKIRLGERLSVRIDVPESLSEMAFAPRLLQTLVENAIKHGVEPKIGDVEITVAAGWDVADHNAVWIEVRDTGVGLRDQPSTRGTGLGLRNVRERLAHLYGNHAGLTIIGQQEGGVIARLDIMNATR